jgi:hypothetical protein
MTFCKSNVPFSTKPINSIEIVDVGVVIKLIKSSGRVQKVEFVEFKYTWAKKTWIKNEHKLEFGCYKLKVNNIGAL